MKVQVGNCGVLKNLGDRLYGCPVQVTEVNESSEGTMLAVRTMRCLGAQPAGIIYDVHPYEFEVRDVMFLQPK